MAGWRLEHHIENGCEERLLLVPAKAVGIAKTLTLAHNAARHGRLSSVETAPAAARARLDHQTAAFRRLDDIDLREVETARRVLKLVTGGARKHRHPTGAVQVRNGSLKVIHSRHPIVMKPV